MERPKTGGAWVHDDDGKLMPADEPEHIKAKPQAEATAAVEAASEKDGQVDAVEVVKSKGVFGFAKKES